MRTLPRGPWGVVRIYRSGPSWLCYNVLICHFGAWHRGISGCGMACAFVVRGWYGWSVLLTWRRGVTWICTTFTPQIKGNNRAIYLIFPLHQGIIMILPSPQGIIMILPGKVVPLNSLIYSLIYKPKWNYTLI